MSEPSGPAHIKNHATLHVKSKAVITLRIESVPPTESVINTIMTKIQSYLQAHLIDHCDFNAPFWKEPTEEDGENSKGINDTLPSDQQTVRSAPFLKSC